MYQVFNGKFIDYYQLTMAQGYFLSGRGEKQATFDYFFRNHPFGSGYTVFSGLSDFLEALKNFTFAEEDLNYLKKTGLHKDFIAYLKDFRFKGSIHSVKEGEIAFPNEPVLKVEGNILETQLIETMLLNILNFHSLVATKALRMRYAAGDRKLIDFGLRRAQGLGGLHASKAAIAGGFDGTSNVQAGFDFDIPVSGTMAHSWVQSYESEEEAFREFAKYYPENCILLIDTYDTLKSGIHHAIKIGKELEEKGYKLSGVRLDSGDLAYLSKKVRKILDDNKLPYVNIITSNQLDEYTIKSLLDQKAPIDGFGVGTRLVTGQPDAALDGVFKLVSFDGKAQIKTSDNITKQTLPGKKKLMRFYNEENQFYADAILLEEEKEPEMMYHPHHPEKHCSLTEFEQEELQVEIVKKGEIIPESILKTEEIKDYTRKRFEQLPGEHKRFENPHIYKVGISKALLELRNELVASLKSNFSKRR